MSKQIALPADVYDALEFAALVWGGVGKGNYYTGDGEPCCIRGLAEAVDDAPDDISWWCYDGQQPQTVNQHLSRAFYPETVSQMNDEIFADTEDQIPFDEWCKRLNVVRGE